MKKITIVLQPRYRLLNSLTKLTLIQIRRNTLKETFYTTTTCMFYFDLRLLDLESSNLRHASCQFTFVHGTVNRMMCLRLVRWMAIGWLQGNSQPFDPLMSCFLLDFCGVGVSGIAQTSYITVVFHT